MGYTGKVGFGGGGLHREGSHWRAPQNRRRHWGLKPHAPTRACVRPGPGRHPTGQPFLSRPQGHAGSPSGQQGLSKQSPREERKGPSDSERGLFSLTQPGAGLG